MRGSKKDLQTVEDYGEGFVSQQVEWGGMIVEISSFPAGIDSSPIFRGLPDDRCQSPHWGYMLKGRMRIKYEDREEVIEEGDVYYLPPGHVPIYEQATEVVEFKDDYQKTLEVVARNMAAGPQGPRPPR